MDKTIYQSGRLYLWDPKVSKYRWVVSPEVAVKVWGRDWEKKSRNYPTQIDDPTWIGNNVTYWPENNGNDGNSNGHKTDRLYKMLYVCPHRIDTLDAIKEIGFNTIHTYDPFQWEQSGYWDSEDGRKDCLKQINEFLLALLTRNMYGCLQVPHQKHNLQDMVSVMKNFGNAIASTVEEPDLHIPPSPTLKGQQRLYDIIKDVADIPVWGCFNGGQWPVCMNTLAYDLIMTDSYPYQRGNGSVPGTQAAEGNDISLPWWKLNPWIHDRKIPMMKKVLPKDMPLIIIQQGMWNTSEGHVLPNINEEWEVYHEEFGTNSFAIYPHGEGQGMDGVYVMTDNESADYGVKNQCRSLMKKLNEMEVK